MRAIGVIPARYDSGRFPGKALTQVAGVSLLRRVYEGACAAKSLRGVIVATDDRRIADAAREFGADVVFTRSDHPTGSDRVAEVATHLDDDIIVDIQGDEPLIEGFVIDAAVEALCEDPDAPMATVVHAADASILGNDNRVKVALDRRGNALYFSRSAIPAQRNENHSPPVWQHVGLYAFRRPFLLEFTSLPRGPLECSEELEQLRALEHGHRIRCATVEGWQSTPVDVPNDVATVEARLAAAGRR
jgi:3-deoxy-manno-octulosonate cytidylyltransferase (CMP-KDO synthetase)